MSTPDEVASFIDEVDGLCRAVLAAEDPYEAGLALLFAGLRSGTAAHPPVRDWSVGLWLVWGSLTDGVDRPDSTPESGIAAVDGMRRAAREWLDLPRHDHEARRRYLDRWVYDECGYERREA